MSPRFDASDKLYRQGTIDRTGLAVLRIVGAALELVRVERGWPRAGLWQAIKASHGEQYRWHAPVGPRTPAVTARQRLARLRNHFQQQHQLAALDTLVAVALGERLPVAARELVELVEAINLAARHLAEPSPRGRKRGGHVVATIAQKISDQPFSRG